MLPNLEKPLWPEEVLGLKYGHEGNLKRPLDSEFLIGAESDTEVLCVDGQGGSSSLRHFTLT